MPRSRKNFVAALAAAARNIAGATAAAAVATVTVTATMLVRELPAVATTTTMAAVERQARRNISAKTRSRDFKRYL